MNRTELERLDRDALIAQAEAAGVTRARILTRPELVDELLIRGATDQATLERTRGLFGLARDLLARVVERGLHLPDAAERIRAIGSPRVQLSAPAALPTLTLAEIYAAQGHRARAIETLEGVLSREPDHDAALALIARLRDSSYPVQPPRMPPEKEEDDGGSRSSDALQADGGVPPRVPPQPAEPMHMMDDSPLPTHYDVDECVAIPVDPNTLYVYWEVRRLTLAYLRARQPGGKLGLRVVVIEPTWDGPKTSLRDCDGQSQIGDRFVDDLPTGCVVRVAIGYFYAGGFLSVAHSPALETAPGAPSALVADALVRWTLQGAVPVAKEDPDAPSIERAVERVRRDSARFPRKRGSGQVALGSSERVAHAEPHQTTSNG
jgi:hypothetical protein